MRIYPKQVEKNFNYLYEHNYDGIPSKIIDGHPALLLYDSQVTNRIIKPLQDKLGISIHQLSYETKVGKTNLKEAIKQSEVLVRLPEEVETIMTSNHGRTAIGHWYYLK